jgi:hypothetical protein
MEHDLCYGQNCSIFDVARSPECDRCDDRAVQCWLRAVAADPARYGTSDNIRYLGSIFENVERFLK